MTEFEFEIGVSHRFIAVVRVKADSEAEAEALATEMVDRNLIDTIDPLRPFKGLTGLSEVDTDIEMLAVTPVVHPALAAIDALIATHDATCPVRNPDACPACAALWNARAEVHHLVDAMEEDAR